jgi:hypothetical protein
MVPRVSGAKFGLSRVLAMRQKAWISLAFSRAAGLTIMLSPTFAGSKLGRASPQVPFNYLTDFDSTIFHNVYIAKGQAAMADVKSLMDILQTLEDLVLTEY